MVPHAVRDLGAVAAREAGPEKTATAPPSCFAPANCLFRRVPKIDAFPYWLLPSLPKKGAG